MRSRSRQYYEKFGELFFVTSTVAGFVDIFGPNALSVHQVSAIKHSEDVQQLLPHCLEAQSEDTVSPRTGERLVSGGFQTEDKQPLCEILINALNFYQRRGDFRLIGYVIMPNHFHLLIKIAPGNSISKLIGNFKKYSSHQIVRYLEENNCTDLLRILAYAAAKEPSCDCRIWKPRFDCFVLNNEETISQKLEYIHNNPVNSHLADQANGWRYSSARNYSGFEPVNLEVDVNWESLGYGKIPSGETPDGA